MTVRGFNILHVDSSPVLEGSVTRLLSARIVARIVEQRPDATVTVRDVGRDPPGHATTHVVDLIRFKRFDALTAAQAEEKALSDRLVAELLAADVIVIGTPMYNFTVTTQLKAWLDRVCQAGLTFRYTPEGPVGLATGKRAILAASRGGNYLAPERAHQDFQLPYLKQILGFVGVSDISVVVAEGVNISPEHRAQALEMAGSQIERMFAADGSAAPQHSAADCMT
ncbi:MAG TPA: NAD(P)H-dependent oxidoreductase [Caulobacteraceae bacterium]|jgi:FMN-dependent NADH-azoreductase